MFLLCLGNYTNILGVSNTGWECPLVEDTMSLSMKHERANLHKCSRKSGGKRRLSSAGQKISRAQ